MLSLYGNIRSGNCFYTWDMLYRCSRCAFVHCSALDMMKKVRKITFCDFHWESLLLTNCTHQFYFSRLNKSRDISIHWFHSMLPFDPSPSINYSKVNHFLFLSCASCELNKPEKHTDDQVFLNGSLLFTNSTIGTFVWSGLVLVD